MSEFIEVTIGSGQKVLVNVNEIASIYGASNKREDGTNASIWGRSDNSVWLVTESYDSIKETLRIRGLNVFAVVNVDGPRQVLFPRAWLERISPMLEAFCKERHAKLEAQGRLTCYEDCPLCDHDQCIREIVWKGDLPHA